MPFAGLGMRLSRLWTWARLRLDTEPVRLVERETELASLAQYAEEARSGMGWMALVAGQAGGG